MFLAGGVLGPLDAGSPTGFMGSKREKKRKEIEKAVSTTHSGLTYPSTDNGEAQVIVLFRGKETCNQLSNDS